MVAHIYNPSTQGSKGGWGMAREFKGNLGYTANSRPAKAALLFPESKVKSYQKLCHAKVRIINLPYSCTQHFRIITANYAVSSSLAFCTRASFKRHDSPMEFKKKKKTGCKSGQHCAFPCSSQGREWF